MAPDTNSPFAARTAGSLEGLEAAGLDQLAAEQLAVGLAVLGDGMRLALPLPGPLRKQLRELGRETILGAIAHVATLPATWSLPASVPAGEDDDPGLAWALRQRDEIDSVMVAARSALMPRKLGIDEALIAKLREALDDANRWKRFPRSLAEALLGERLEIAGDAGWMDAASWAEEAADEAPIAELERAVAAATPPGDRALESYVVGGHLAAWVEAAAARSSDVAENLASMIETYREQKAPVSFVARRWQHDRGARAGAGAAGGALITFDPPALDLRRAAADAGGIPDVQGVEHRLGLLAPLDAEARLFVSEGDVTLEVFEGDSPLAQVTFGGVSATRETDAAYQWRVTVPRTAGALELVVVGESGLRFEDKLAIGERT